MFRTALAAFGAAVSPAAAAASASTARAAEALRVRTDAALAQSRRVRTPTESNGDEMRYSAPIASYGKGLPHADTGIPDAAAFEALRLALASGRAAAFEQIPGGVVRQVNPCAAYAYTLEGPDPQALFLPAAPRFDSAQQAADACELYWQALTRDVPFDEYEGDQTIAGACADLSRLTGYRGPRAIGSVTPATIFRGRTTGDLTGPWLSQFLLKEVPYGAIRLVPHVRTATAGLDYLVTWNDWLRVQRGAATIARHAGAWRYIRTARDLAAYVQVDFSYQPFLTALLVLFGMEGSTDARRTYKGAPYDVANPYRRSATQAGFATFGMPHALDLVARVANHALQHAWSHKWLVHRRLRPEAFAARVDAHRRGRERYPLHDELLASPALDRLDAKHRSSLLPQAYPDGCPLHPSYPSGHATIAGACVTVLKAFFDESFPIEEPVIVGADGLSLAPWRGATLTVGGELDKLASNIALGRNAAGVHWRSDNTAGLELGETLAIELLRELRACHREPFDGFSLTRFDGARVTV